MKRVIIPMIIVAFIASLSGCGDSGKRVLAKVDGEIITVKDFNDRIEKLPKQYQEAVKNQKRSYLNDLIMEKLLYKKALRANIDKDRETQDIIAEATKKIIIARLVEKEVENKVKVSDEEAKKYYDENSEEFMLPERWRASHILVDTLEEANAIKEKLGQGASFEELAKEKSKDATAKIGGDIGYFSKGQLVPEFEEECYKLKVGEIGSTVKTQFGYHVIKLTDKKNPEVQEFSSVKELIKRELSRNKKKDLLDKMMTDAKNKAKIVINEKLIEEEIKKDAAEKAPEKATEKK
ncbi:MAG: peptidylprolyl isomerase [Candidatus Omnitrophica bacterium]|nr:peptidylprolyl isomerase [Candidatus Omnitrophota bacterium]